MAYVAAWVWVPDSTRDDDSLRADARHEYGEEGRIEIDDDADVSREES